jgi:hypothetical protein
MVRPVLVDSILSEVHIVDKVVPPAVSKETDSLAEEWSRIHAVEAELEQRDSALDAREKSLDARARALERENDKAREDLQSKLNSARSEISSLSREKTTLVKNKKKVDEEVFRGFRFQLFF